ncbi:unnamed protein product [Symbiodinium sp. CCMP2456]|nr:unnamed protein product [Symbiodinium sp. CCMP2456]
MCLRWHHFGIAWLLAWAGESASVLDMMTQTEPGSAWRKPSTGHCPPGASVSVPFGSHRGCFCNFGFSGLLHWDPSGGRYRGACTQTPCPSGTEPGQYAGECFCRPPSIGHIVWRRAESKGSEGGKNSTGTLGVASFHGECVLLPCPDGSSRASDWLDHGVRLPRCSCRSGQVGGFIWQPNASRFSGRCVDENPCAPGYAGGRMIAFHAPHGKPSGSAQVRMLGKCERVVCPPHADIDESGLCHCQPPYNGSQITWNAELLMYSGECSPYFHCPPRTVYRKVDLSVVNRRLACVCRDGYAGGHMSWDAWGHRVWHGDCQLVACPLGAQRHGDGLCHCRNGSLTWDAIRGNYEGLCAQGHRQKHEPWRPQRPTRLIRHRGAGKDGQAQTETAKTNRERQQPSAIPRQNANHHSSNDTRESAAAHPAAKHGTSDVTSDSEKDTPVKPSSRALKFAHKVPTEGAAVFFHAFWCCKAAAGVDHPDAAYTASSQSWINLTEGVGSLQEFAACVLALMKFTESVRGVVARHCQSPVRFFANGSSVGIMAWLGGRSSFYVDCDAFNTSATAPSASLITLLTRLECLLIQQLRLPIQSCLTVNPTKILTARVNIVFEYFVTYVLADVAKFQFAEVCLSLKGIGPMGTGMKSEMRPCFHGLEEASDGAWQPTKVPKDELWLPDGTVVPMRLYPNSQNLVHQAQMGAQVPALFATLCGDRRASSRRLSGELGAFL